MRAIAKAMGFAPEAWFDEDAVGEPLGRSDDSRGVAGRIEHLFDAIRNPKTGEPYTNAEVARMTLGGLSEDDIEGIRTGEIPDPTVGQVVALAGIFGVEPSYLLDRGEPVFDKQLVEALRDETIREATREISRLPERERRLCWGSCASSTVQKGPALPLTQGSRLIEKLLPAKRTPATHTSFECGISASSTVQSTNHRPVSFKILIAENGARRIELAGA